MKVEEETFAERLVRECVLRTDEITAISSWDGIQYAFQTNSGNLFVNSGQDAIVQPHSTTEVPELKALDAAQKADPSPWMPARLDRYTQEYALWVLKNQQPRFLYISLDDSDEYGHLADYDHYIKSLRNHDLYLKKLVKTLDEAGTYGKNTVLIYTTDHGRGRGVFWQGHSRELLSAHQVFAYVMIPEALQKKVRKRKGSRFSHADIRPTIESLFNLKPRECDGCGTSLLEFNSR